MDHFLDLLWAAQPDSIVASGGADGVDTRAETGWVQRGGIVWSYRIKKKGVDHYVIEKWEIVPQGGSRVYELLGEPSWADPVSALWYRSMLLAEVCTRCVAFYGIGNHRGTEFTVEVSEFAEGKPTYIYDK